LKNISVIDTKDGSRSLLVSDLNETYHSTHGAVSESEHVYIKMGLEYAMERFAARELKVFELGFGTGLNALLTARYAADSEISVMYESIEKYPLSLEVHRELAYSEQTPLTGSREDAEAIYSADWNVPVAINDRFTIKKVEGDFFDISPKQEKFHLLYFDAFGFRAQSELWGERAFNICADLLLPGGILVTYAAKGSARRAMIAAGFDVEKLPGAPGKREMLRAIRNS